jgi:hypothetical protein
MSIAQRIAARYLERWRRSRPQPNRDPADGSGRRLLLIDASADPPAPGQAAAGNPDPAPHPVVPLLAPLMGDEAPDAVAAILLREDPAELDALNAALGARGWTGRIRRTPELHLSGGEAGGTIGLAEGTPASRSAELLPLLERSARTLVRVAPASPATMPFTLTRALAERPDTDLLLELSPGELNRLERYRTTPVADLPLHLRRMVEGWSAFLGDARLEWLATWRAVAAAEGTAQAQLRVVESFETRLREAVPAAIIRRFAVPLGGAAGGGELHFVLATHEPARALHLNRILFEMRSEGVLPWVEPTDPLVRLENPGIIELFAAANAAPPGGEQADEYGPRVRTVDLPRLAEGFADRFAGEVVPLRETMRFVAAGELFVEDVHGALRLLRRERRVSYPTLSDDDAVLRFPAPGAPLDSPPTRRRARGPRGDAEPELW